MGNRVVYLPAYEAEVEYLETDGDSYIDTGLKASSELGVLAHIQNSQDVTSFLFGGCDERNNNEFAFIGLSDAGNSIYRFGTGSIDGAKLDADIIYEFDNTQSHNIMEVGNLTYTAPTTTFESSYNLILFGENRRGVRQKSIGVRIYDFKIYSGSTLVRDFIPVRIGTTGYMYDKVSRQLFANAGTGRFVLGNDVANATVPQLRHVVYFGGQRCVGFEKLYERKEWLVGDGSAYINTKVKLHFATDSVYIKGSKNGVATDKSRFFGNYRGGENAKSLELIYYTSVQNDTVSKPFVTDGRFGINPSSEFEFYTTPFSSTTSVSIIYNGDTTIFNVNLNEEYLEYEASNDLILLNTNDTHYCMKADVANFKVIRSSTIIRNLIPCTLTMDLPASMDANNIARTKGTSGMWDLVSDRFYGNVANSGTFKAVNLAENVDYEVHQWLGSASGNPYIKVQDGVNTDENAYIETTYKCNYSNTGTDIIIGFSITESNNIGIRIFNTGNRTYVDYHKMVNGVLSSLRKTIVQSNINAERYIKATFDKLIIDNTEYQISLSDGFDTINQRHTRLNFNSENNAVNYKRTKIRVNNIEYDLIPVKLLRSIPSKYDANGRVRQAGECGMYDTVNDLFYGNVASSGVFSVSDD